jgi:hypothetical protein
VLQNERAGRADQTGGGGNGIRYARPFRVRFWGSRGSDSPDAGFKSDRGLSLVGSVGPSEAVNELYGARQMLKLKYDMGSPNPAC